MKEFIDLYRFCVPTLKVSSNGESITVVAQLDNDIEDPLDWRAEKDGDVTFAPLWFLLWLDREFPLLDVRATAFAFDPNKSHITRLPFTQGTSVSQLLSAYSDAAGLIWGATIYDLPGSPEAQTPVPTYLGRRGEVSFTIRGKVFVCEDILHATQQAYSEKNLVKLRAALIELWQSTKCLLKSDILKTLEDILFDEDWVANPSDLRRVRIMVLQVVSASKDPRAADFYRSAQNSPDSEIGEVAKGFLRELPQ